MPERIAATDPMKQMTEVVGSGPYRFLPDDFVAGAQAAYAKFDGYVPRPNGTPDRAAGPKIVHFERVVWTTMPDQGVALAALQTGEQDWWEYASQDLLPLIRRDPNLRGDLLVFDNLGASQTNEPEAGAEVDYSAAYGWEGRYVTYLVGVRGLSYHTRNVSTGALVDRNVGGGVTFEARFHLGSHRKD